MTSAQEGPVTNDEDTDDGGGSEQCISEMGDYLGESYTPAGQPFETHSKGVHPENSDNFLQSPGSPCHPRGMCDTSLPFMHLSEAIMYIQYRLFSVSSLELINVHENTFF